MRMKLSEKKLIAGAFFFAIGAVLLVQAPFILTPVRISEKSILLCILALVCLALAVWFFKRAAVKV